MSYAKPIDIETVREGLDNWPVLDDGPHVGPMLDALRAWLDLNDNAEEIIWCDTHKSAQLDSGRWPRCAVGRALGSKRICRFEMAILLRGVADRVVST